MLWSKTFIPTLREVPQEAESVAHQLLLRAGLIRPLMSGVYSYLPLGLKVLNNIEKIIRQEMDSCGACEVLLPALQPVELWQKSGRDKQIADVLIRFTDRKGRDIALGPTHEEVITDLVRNRISSYKQMPLVLYQIQSKFRDEIRPRFGLIRACEFIMKDAYSFDKDQEGLDKNYKALFNAYIKIFKRCGLKILTTEADPGLMGGNVSHEFMAPASNGEDVVLFCPKCKSTKAAKGEEEENCSRCLCVLQKINAIEVGHIFQLGTKYSASLGANFVDEKGRPSPIIMGCYGIGVSRLISAIIEQNNDQDGIIWPNEISPYKAIILALDITEDKIKDAAFNIYSELNKAGIDTLLDDRDERSGVKFKDADLLGIPLQVIIGRNLLKDGTIELKLRKSGERIVKKESEILEEISLLLKVC